MRAPSAIELNPTASRSQPLLSICIPTYNRPLLLERALQTAIAEARRHAGLIEVIVSDNSPEVSESIATEVLIEAGPHGRYVGNRPSVGMIGNFNKCLELATGETILMLHDDDYLLPGAVDRILRSVQAAGSGEVAWLFGVDIVDQNERLIRRQVPQREEFLPPPKALLRLLANSSFVRVPGLVVRRRAYGSVGQFREGLRGADDFDMWIRIFSRYGVRLIPYPISAYSVHMGAATTGMFNAETVEPLLALFEEATSTGVVEAATVRRAQAAWFHQFVLSGVYRSLLAGNAQEARQVMALLRLNRIAELGVPLRWRAVRSVLEVLVRCPPWLATRAAKLARSLGLPARISYVL